MRHSFVWTILRVEESKGFFNIFQIEDEETDKIREEDIFIGGKLQKYETFLFSQNTITDKKNFIFLMEFGVRSAQSSNVILY